MYWLGFICFGPKEPVYGTMCLYNKDTREKLSEDFHFRFLPSDFQDVRWLLPLPVVYGKTQNNNFFHKSCQLE